MRPLIESSDMKISNLLAASACAGMLSACDSPRPEQDQDLYRASIDLTARRAEMMRFLEATQKFYYQTLEYDLTPITHDDGTRSNIGLLGCVLVEAEITDEDRKLNRPIRVTFIEEDTREPIKGTIDASNLSRAEWMRPDQCDAWSLPVKGAAGSRLEDRDINQSLTPLALSPI